MKLNILIILTFLFLILATNNLFAKRTDMKNVELITTFYIDAITLSNDSTPRKNIDVNSNVNSTMSEIYYVVINDRKMIVFAENGYKAELINISGLTIQMKQIFNGKTNFNVNTPGVYLIKISSQNNKTTLLKTIVT